MNLFKMVAYLLKRQTAMTHFEWVKGHDRSLGNKESDKLAKTGAEKEEEEELVLDVPAKFNLQGVKLSTITQAIAYRGICNQTPWQERPSTEQNLQQIKLDLLNLNKTKETSENIWKDIRRPLFHPKVQQFLFKAIHDAFKIGKYWGNIPDCEYRQWCASCHTMETMQHILVDCESAPVRLIWELVKTHWPYTCCPWPNPSLGTILGCGSLALPNTDEDLRQRDKTTKRIGKKGPNRFMQILILDSAYLIWVMRCERAIQHKEHTHKEIHHLWLSVINQRLTIDKITTMRVRLNPQTMSIVIDTWKQLLLLKLPHIWLQSHEVLVGRRSFCTWPWLQSV
jgi:hypothetical protein